MSRTGTGGCIAPAENDIIRVLGLQIGTSRKVDRSVRLQGLPRYRPSACTISSVIFFASPNSIMVLGRKNSSLSTPA